jgi:hypothetical protein
LRSSKYEEVEIDGIKVDYYDTKSKTIHEIKEIEQGGKGARMATEILYVCV